MTPKEADRMQQWAGMDGATAWHLIDRHANNWNEIGELMNAWLRANVAVEREACAKVAEAAAARMGDLGRQHRDEGDEGSMDRCYSRALQCTQIAADIRTRSNYK